MSMPTDEEVEDYDFRLRLEAEENGDEPEDDISDGEDGDGGGGPEDNVGQPQRPVPDEDDTKCKICYENRAKVLTMPCRHAVMCEACYNSSPMKDAPCVVHPLRTQSSYSFNQTFTCFILKYLYFFNSFI